MTKHKRLPRTFWRISRAFFTVPGLGKTDYPRLLGPPGPGRNIHTSRHHQKTKSSVHVHTWSGRSSRFPGCYPVQNTISKSKFQIFARDVQVMDATLGGPPLKVISLASIGAVFFFVLKIGVFLTLNFFRALRARFFHC